MGIFESYSLSLSPSLPLHACLWVSQIDVVGGATVDFLGGGNSTGLISSKENGTISLSSLNTFSPQTYVFGEGFCRGF